MLPQSDETDHKLSFNAVFTNWLKTAKFALLWCLGYLGDRSTQVLCFQLSDSELSFHRHNSQHKTQTKMSFSGPTPLTSKLIITKIQEILNYIK